MTISRILLVLVSFDTVCQKEQKGRMCRDRAELGGMEKEKSNKSEPIALVFSLFSAFCLFTSLWLLYHNVQREVKRQNCNKSGRPKCCSKKIELSSSKLHLCIFENASLSHNFFLICNKPAEVFLFSITGDLPVLETQA